MRPVAGFVLGPGADQPVITAPAMRTVIVARGSITDHEFGLFESRLPPGSSGPVPHWHACFAEIGSGDLVRVPRRRIHAFRPDGDEEARFLILFTPAGRPREEYFAEMAALAGRAEPPTEAEIDAIARRHDQINVR